MRRRRLLRGGAVALGVGVAAGLDWILDRQLGSVGRRPGELREIVVEERRFLAPLYESQRRDGLRRTVRVEQGQVRVDVCCGKPTGRQSVTEGPSLEAHRETQRLVVGLDPAAWRDHYDRQGGWTRRTNELTVTLDGRECGVVYDPNADLPAEIERLRSHLKSHEQRLSDRFGVLSHPCEG